MKSKPRHLLGNNGQGMNWIRPEKRLAIYIRDGFACIYCGKSVEDDAKLTLDHVVCRSHGGSNDASNLITACHTCNSSRGARTIEAFARAVAKYINHGVTARYILGQIKIQTMLRQIDVLHAQELMRRRGFFAVMRRGVKR